MTPFSKSEELFARSQVVIPGGVNSPVRAFKSVGGIPPFIVRASGAMMMDCDGNDYIDYMMSWGPLILGHCHPAVVEAVVEAAARGLSFGAATEAEVELSEVVLSRLPGVEMLRLVNSGTEAAMTAIRLARAATGRDIIVKFDGCYHGHSDAFLVKAGSGLATQGIVGSPGVPNSVIEGIISLPYNNISALEELFIEKGDDIAGVIVEPIAANMGVVLPVEGFLSELRDITSKHGTVLIFDEVISGFRVARGGACEVYGVQPDIICLGKILGGGLPIGGIAGKRDIMEQLAPVGEVYQAGTLSGNPLSVASGLATLRQTEDIDFYDHLHRRTERLAQGLRSLFSEYNLAAKVNYITGLLTVFFGRDEVVDYESARSCDMERYAKFHRLMLKNGVYLPPSGFEAWFVSIEHGDVIIDRSLDAVKASLEEGL